MQLDQDRISRDYSKLPRKYWLKQNVCWYMHDVIVSLFKEATNEKLMNQEIKISNESEYIELEKSESVYEWLKLKGRDSEIIHLTCKDVSMRLLEDFLNYIYEVLSNIERGKITISYDLLRKPFKDNLFYLEWILFDDNEITNLLHYNDSESYALDYVKYWKKKKIVLNSTKINKFISQFSKREIEYDIFNIRYNYNCSYSLQLVWNKAIHLVTTGDKIKTQDFNFIFNNEVDYEMYLEYFYSKIPLLLFYTIGVVENIFDRYFKSIPKSIKDYNRNLITAKYLYYLNDEKEVTDYSLYDLVGEFLYIPCYDCKKIIKIEKSDYHRFSSYLDIQCPECKRIINICRYFLLDFNK